MGWRPPLPPGPYLVVGLARSGQAALRVLGDQARGVDRKQGDDTPIALERDRRVVALLAIHPARLVAEHPQRGLPGPRKPDDEVRARRKRRPPAHLRDAVLVDREAD